MEYIFDETESILEVCFGSMDNEKCTEKIQRYLLENCYDLMIENISSQE